jgi:hypothetical protein
LFYGAKLKKNFNPNDYVTYLEDSRSRMEDIKYKMTDDQFILQVVNSLTEDYMNKVKSLENEIGSVTDWLDIQDVRGELNLKFERLRTLGKYSSDDDGEEPALFAIEDKPCSKKCNHCGKFGHKSDHRYLKGKSIRSEQGKGQGGEVKSSEVTAFIAKILDTKPLVAPKRKRRTLGLIKPMQLPRMIKMMIWQKLI